MPHFFIILLKINLVLVLFSTAYYLVLRRLTFYTINRLFLVFGIVFATVYPFIDLTDFFHQQNPQAAFVPNLNEKVTAMVPTKLIALNWQLLTILFYVGVVLMALRLVMQFVSLYRMHQKSRPGAIDNHRVRILDEAVSPFSFWQTVYINPSLHKQNELHTILAHEQVHVKQWHSLDIILAELSVVFYWFNPGVWLMKKAVKENLEFITDQKILNNGIDRKAYQYSLLDVGNLIPAVEIVNNFNLSDLKKRIKMMNSKRSSKLTLSRYLLVLPVLLLTTLAFTISKKEIKKHFSPLKAALVQAHIIDAPKVDSLTSVKVKQLPKKKKADLVVQAKPDTVSKFSYLINTIFISRDSTVAAAAYAPKQITLKRAEGMPVNELSDLLQEKVVGELLTFKSDSLFGNQAKKGRVATINISYVSSDEAPVEHKKNVVVKGYAILKGTRDTTKTNIAYMLDGKKINANELNTINPDLIKKVTVLRNSIPTNETIVIGRKSN